VRRQELAALNRMFASVAWLLLIVLLGAAACAGPSGTTSRLTMDRRRMHTLRNGRPSDAPDVGILLILLVIFGPPSNLGTFLGLVGAGSPSRFRTSLLRSSAGSSSWAPTASVRAILWRSMA
jgi:hypothetical protein